MITFDVKINYVQMYSNYRNKGYKYYYLYNYSVKLFFIIIIIFTSSHKRSYTWEWYDNLVQAELIKHLTNIFYFVHMVSILGELPHSFW